MIARFEEQEQRAPSAEDLPALRQQKAEVCAAQGFPESAIDDRLLESYAAHGGEMPAINAVVGGVLANEVLKAVSKKGDPICNFFLFSLTDGAGLVERAGGAAGGAA